MPILGDRGIKMAKFIKTYPSYDSVKERCPKAAMIVRVQDGFLVFDYAEEYYVWRKEQKDINWRKWRLRHERHITS